MIRVAAFAFRLVARLAVVGVAAGCANAHVASPAQHAATAATGAAAPLHVRVAVARQGQIRPELTLSGLIAPRQNVTISNGLNEPATSVRVNEGDLVRRGEVLAELDTADLRANLDAAQRSAAEAQVKVEQTRYQGRMAIAQGLDGFHSAQDTLAQAVARLAVDRRNLERDQTLLGSGYISHQAYEAQLQLVVNDLAAVRSARSALQNARTTVAVNGTDERGLQATTVRAAAAAAAAARSQAEQARAQLTKATIISPIDGIVVNRNINPGEYPGSRVVFTIQDTATVYAVLNATTSQVFAVRSGDAVDIVPARGQGAAAHGIVTAVLGQADPGSTNFTVKARVENARHLFQSGMVVTGVVHLPPVSGIVIPTTAFTDDTRAHVVAVRGGMARAVAVREVVTAHGASVVTGLRPGDRVVANGQLGIADGQPVAASG